MDVTRYAEPYFFSSSLASGPSLLLLLHVSHSHQDPAEPRQITGMRDTAQVDIELALHVQGPRDHSRESSEEACLQAILLGHFFYVFLLLLLLVCNLHAQADPGSRHGACAHSQRRQLHGLGAGERTEAR